MNFTGIATDTFGRATKVGGPVVVVGGVFADVVAPLAPIALYVTILAATITMVTGCVWFFGYRRKFVAAMRDGKIDANEARELASTNRWSLLFAFSFIATVIMGVVTGAGAAISEDDRGILATTIPGLQKLQDDLFDLKKDVAEIKKTTEKISSDTTDIKEKTEKISSDTTDIKAKLEDIAESFKNLQGRGGIIPNPASPQDQYHNARLHEMGANFPAADKSYRAYFEYRLEFVDPHLRYSKMLKMWQGSEDAEETYDYFVQVYKIPAVRLARALLNSKSKRLAPIEALAEAEPDFAPAWYQIALHYSPKKRPTQTLSDKKREKEALAKLRSLDEKGKFVRWFLDKSVVAEWKEEAERRWSALEVEAKAPPVSLGTMKSNQGWSLIFQIRERGVDEIFYQLDGKGEFLSTGHNPAVKDSLTGKPLANMYVALPHIEPGAHTVKVKYRNMRGEEQGPYSFPFDPDAELIKNTKHTLHLTASSWISYRAWDAGLLVYFTHLTSSKEVFKEIRYSIDSDALDTLLPFEPGYINVPHETKFVMVKIQFKDGTESEAKRFDNRSESTNLEKLEISWFDNKKARKASGLINIKELLIPGGTLTDQGLPLLSKMTKMEILNLSDCDKITDEGLAHLKPFTQLRDLNLSRMKLITDEGLAHLQGFDHLKILNLSENRDITGTGLNPLLKLNTLLLKKTGITDEGLAQVGKLTTLTTLDLGNNKFTDAGFAHLSGLVNLEILDLNHGIAITDAGLQHLKGLTKLQNLNLRYFIKITNAGLANLEGMSNLQTLDLDNCRKLNDAGLAVLKGFPELKDLNLEGCNLITDAGLLHLKELKNLSDLNLYRTKVTDAGVATLAGMIGLKNLNVERTGITKKGLKALRKALPDCTIED